MSSVLAFMITRADTPQRLQLLRETVKGMYETAGHKFDLHINTLNDQARDSLTPVRGDFRIVTWDENVGQHVIMNREIQLAAEGGYTYLLRVDDDCKFITKRWLAKMLEAADKLGPHFIISPTVLGLERPPESTEVVEKDGVKIRVLVSAIGGICRLHNVSTLCDSELPYVSDVRQPLGAGDASGIAYWCHKCAEAGRPRWMVYLNNVRVKHAKGTTQQVKDDPGYHSRHALFQVMPYVPKWRGDEDSYSRE